MSDTLTPTYLTAAQVAERAGLKVETVYRYLIRREEGAGGRHPIPEPFRVGRTLMWAPEVIDAWLDERSLARADSSNTRAS